MLISIFFPTCFSMQSVVSCNSAFHHTGSLPVLQNPLQKLLPSCSPVEAVSSFFCHFPFLSAELFIPCVVSYLHTSLVTVLEYARCELGSGYLCLYTYYEYNDLLGCFSCLCCKEPGSRCVDFAGQLWNFALVVWKQPLDNM